MQTSLILDKIPLGIIVFNEASEIISINGRGEKYIEKTSNFLLGIIREMVKNTLVNDETIEKIIRFSDHDELFIWNVKTEFIRIKLPQIAVIIQDNTLNIKLEQSILKAERLAVMGYLAIGSLMEIRNPLTSARGFCQLIKDDDKVKKDYLEILSKELEQIQHIIESHTAVSEPSKSKYIGSIYHKLWTCIHNKVLTYKLIMITDSYEDMLINNISEVQINTMLKLIQALNIWAEENIYIISFESNKESRSLKVNFGSMGRTHREISGYNKLDKTISRCKIDNNQLNLHIENNLAMNVDLNFEAI